MRYTVAPEQLPDLIPLSTLPGMQVVSQDLSSKVITFVMAVKGLC